MDPSGRMLFLRRSAQAEQHAGHWDFPGGSIEDGEEAHEAAARECDEETHYYPFGVYPDILPEVAGDDWHYTTFAHSVDQPFKPELNDEHDDHVWATGEEALEHLNLRPGIRQILTGTRDAFDPDEPRNDIGEWTSGGTVLVNYGTEKTPSFHRIEVLQNPTPRELERLATKVKLRHDVSENEADMRILKEGDDYFVWDAAHATHDAMAKGLGLKHGWYAESLKHVSLFTLSQARHFGFDINKIYHDASFTADAVCDCGGVCAKCRDERKVFHAFGSVA